MCPARFFRADGMCCGHLGSLVPRSPVARLQTGPWAQRQLVRHPCPPHKHVHKGLEESILIWPFEPVQMYPTFKYIKGQTQTQNTAEPSGWKLIPFTFFCNIPAHLEGHNATRQKCSQGSMGTCCWSTGASAVVTGPASHNGTSRLGEFSFGLRKV